MIPTWEYSDLEHELLLAVLNMIEATETMRGAVAQVAEETRADIQMRMPVDTGAAQASWGANPAPGVSRMKGLEGIWEFTDAGLTNTQGSERDSYNYIIRLNEGYSRQAPAGFIDAAAERGAIKLERATEKIRL